jgi:hypothetical protein
MPAKPPNPIFPADFPRKNFPNAPMYIGRRKNEIEHGRILASVGSHKPPRADGDRRLGGLHCWPTVLLSAIPSA